MNETIAKFGYPDTLVAELDHWLILLRPQQVTLGSLVLAAKSESTAFSGLPTDAFAEMGVAVKRIEQGLRTFVDYERINYLMLMMVDPHVHFHVIPRYADFRDWEGIRFTDAGWPGPPALSSAQALRDDQISLLVKALNKII